MLVSSSGPRVVALTGATGFVGRRTRTALEQHGHHVRALSRTPDTSSVHWNIGDSIESSVAVLRGVDTVVHAAAYVPATMADQSEAEECLRVNALGTLRLLRAAELAGVRRFIHISTAAVYGPGSGSSTALELPQRASAYIASKLAAEVYVAERFRAHSPTAAIVRLSAVYGPGMKSGGLVPNCVRSLREQGMFAIADGNRFTTDLVFVDDVAQAIVCCADSDAIGVYNIGSGTLSTPLDVARAAAHGLGLETPDLRVAPPLSQPAPATFESLDIGPARRDFGFSPRSLDDGMKSYIASLV